MSATLMSTLLSRGAAALGLGGNPSSHSSASGPPGHSSRSKPAKQGYEPDNGNSFSNSMVDPIFDYQVLAEIALVASMPVMHSLSYILY